MKLLLDTHTVLWHADANPQLSASAVALLLDPKNDLFISMASIWETAIKSGMKKLVLTGGYANFMAKAINDYNLIVLPITLEDCVSYEQLPFPDPNHRDPFDRMIVVQAGRNGLSVVGIDSSLDAYGITRLW